MRMATCHPDRKHAAKGLCNSCYNVSKVNREKAKGYKRKYYKRNKQKILAKATKRRKDNPEHYKEWYATWAEENRERIRKRRKIWEEKNRDHLNEYHKNYQRNRRQVDITFKLIGNLRCRLYKAILGQTKKKPTMELVGCSLDDLKQHLENQFESNMSWDNYGEWHIDHIIPLASAADDEEIQELFHYSNLQPLWAFDNLTKGGISMSESLR